MPAQGTLQQPRCPLVGLPYSALLAGSTHLISAFRQDSKEAGLTPRPTVRHFLSAIRRCHLMAHRMRYKILSRILLLVLFILAGITGSYETEISNGPAQAVETDKLIQQFKKLSAAGRYSEAIPIAEGVLAKYEETVGPNDPKIATILNDVAALYQEQGRYGDAELPQKRALAIYKQTLGADHPNVGTASNNLAALYQRQGRYAEAEELHKQSLTINEEKLGSGHPNVATSLNNLAELYREQGRYAEAEPLHKRALALREKAYGPDNPVSAGSMTNLGLLYQDIGNHVDAERLYKSALTINEKILGPDHPSTGESLDTLASLYDSQERPVEGLHERALAIREKALGPNHPYVATSLNNLASFYLNQKRYRDAERFEKRSLEIREKIFGPDHSIVADTLHNLASIYQAQKRYTEAESLYKRALLIRERAFGLDHLHVAINLNNLGTLYNDQNRYVEAEPLFVRALEIRERLFGQAHPGFASALNKLAFVYDHQDRTGDALKVVKRAIANGIASKNITLSILSQARSENIISAVEAFSDSYNTVQKAVSSAAGNAISKLAVRFAAKTDELSALVRKEQDLTVEDEALDKVLISFLAKAPAERNESVGENVRRRIESIKSEFTKLQRTLIQYFPDYVTLAKPQSLSLEQTQALLSNDEALVVFDFAANSFAWVITRTNAEWVELEISAGELETKVRELRASLTFNVDKPFDTRLAHKLYQETFGTFAKKIASKKRLSVVTNGALTSLPLHLLITKNPSGSSLRDVEWLVRFYAITIYPSVASLKALRETSSTAAVKPMIAFADPVFSKEKRDQTVIFRGITNYYSSGQPDLISLAKALPQLPETAQEVRSIGRVIKVAPEDLKLGMFASETAVKQSKLDEYRIVYFATHGLLAGEVEQFAKAKAEPALVLTLPEYPSDEDDGLLTASEVSQLKLNADWVVLSACNTASEDRPGAEALSGLARAFFYAGARSLIVSNWDVESNATVELMVKTFQVGVENSELSHAEALRQAMLSMIRNAKYEEEAHPRLWAAFIIVGEPAIQR